MRPQPTQATKGLQGLHLRTGRADRGRGRRQARRRGQEARGRQARRRRPGRDRLHRPGQGRLLRQLLPRRRLPLRRLPLHRAAALQARRGGPAAEQRRAAVRGIYGRRLDVFVGQYKGLEHGGCLANRCDRDGRHDWMAESQIATVSKAAVLTNTEFSAYSGKCR